MNSLRLISGLIEKNTHPVVDERLPALDDGDPLGVPRGPPVDGRVHSHAQVLDLVSIVDS